jgi:hypothetical protein
MGEKIYLYRVLVGKPDGKRYLKNLVVRGGIILKWISKR